MAERRVIKSYKDLEVYQESYTAALDVFWLTRTFPKEESYSLTSQIVRSSRSVAANICEGWAKRSYENVFKQHLIHTIGSCLEANTWLDFAKDCKYININVHQDYQDRYEVIGKKLNQLHQRWKSY